MTTDNTYQGWSNYETWAVNLWLTNEEGSARELDRLANRGPGTISDKASQLKQQVQWQEPTLPASMHSDLMQHAIGKVDFHEIIAAAVEDETQI